MKKLFNSIGVISITATPLIATVSCAAYDSTYFYKLNVEFNDDIVTIVVEHLPTDNEMNDDFKEEYRRRIYNDLASQLIAAKELSRINKFSIKYVSADYDGGQITHSLAFTNDSEPLRLAFIIPEHVDDEGNYVDQKLFHIATLEGFFSEDILEHVNQDSLLNTSPTTGNVIPGRFTPEGYIVRKLIQDFVIET